MKLSLLFIIIVLALAILNSLILIFKKEKYEINNKMLGWSLLIYNVYLFVYFLWFEAGYILEAPHFLRTVSPLMYLSAPLFYFYVRNTVFGVKGLKKYDFLHFIPALLHFCDLIPFYLESYEFKQSIALKLASEPHLKSQLANGFIPMSFHYPFRACLQIIYFVYCVYLVYREDLKRISNLKKVDVQNWLNISLLLMGIIVFSYFGYTISEMINFNFGKDYTKTMRFFTGATILGVLLLNLYINFNPEEVFFRKHSGLNTLKLEEKKDNCQTDKGSFTVEEAIDYNESVASQELDLLSVKNRIVHLLEKEKIYTTKGVTLTTFSSKTGVTNKLVSLVVHKYFNKGFNELLNGYRVKFAVEKINDGFLDDFTIDSLSEAVGFNSRTTFFNSFKKEMGLTPNEYWKKYQDGEFD